MMAMTRATAICLAAVAALAPQTQRLFAQKYVTVVGNDGRPVAGLASEDFSLRDGDIRRPMQGVEPATTPLAVEIAIAGFGVTDTTFLNSTIYSLYDALKKISAQNEVLGPTLSKGPAVAVIETLLEACAAVGNASTDRRAIVALIRQSATGPTITEPYRLTDALKEVRASFWAIVLVDDQKALASSLDGALASAAQISGGMREVVTTTTAMNETLARMRQLLSAQYLVTFLWPDPMLSQLNIVTRHDSGTVLAPVWNR